MAAKFAGVVSTDADEAVDHLTKEMSHLSRVGIYIELNPSTSISVIS